MDREHFYCNADHPDEASSDCMDEVSPSPPVKPKEEVSSDRRESNSSGPPVTDGNMEEGKNLAKDPAKVRVFPGEKFEH